MERPGLLVLSTIAFAARASPSRVPAPPAAVPPPAPLPARAVDVPAPGFVTVTLRQSRAEEVADLVNELLEASRLAAASRGCVLYPPGAEPSASEELVSVRADAMTNTVILAGSAEDLGAFVILVQRLDGSPPPPATKPSGTLP